jgi:uncharacterized protein with HEPN domain
MSDHDPRVLLIDMVDAMDAITEFSAGMSYQNYLADRKTRDAIYRNIEVMGEAVARMPEYYLNAHTDIPWAKIRSTRNAFIHGYDKIDDSIVWNIVTRLLPDLRNRLQLLLDMRDDA